MLLPVLGAVYGIRRIIKALRAPSNDYSFGNKDIQVVGMFIRNRKFQHAETMISQLSSDDLTQCLDHLTLSFTIKQLQEFNESSPKEYLADLILGVYYSHQAWIARGRAYANQTSVDQADLFYSNLEQSKKYLEQAIKSNLYDAEAHARMIRVTMGMGDLEASHAHFQKSIKRDATHIWAHMHYAECIQPKWGGSVDEINRFASNLPAHKLLRAIVQLKLLHDGFQADENYFDQSMDMESYRLKLAEIVIAYSNDSELSNLQSIHRFVVYGYMYAIAEAIGDKQIAKKYMQLLQGNFPLYPFGILK